MAGYRRFVAEETIWLAVNDEVNLTLSSKDSMWKMVLLRNAHVLERFLFPPGRGTLEREVLPFR